VVDRIKLIVAVLLVAGGIYGFYALSDISVLLRALLVIASIVVAAGVALTSSQGQAALQFAAGARMEVRKVVWPTGRETMQGTLVVIAMVIVLGLYLWLLDSISFWVIYDMVLGVSD
jgi:preprotein translocase subunit SecE